MDQHRELVDALNDIRAALGAPKSYHRDMPSETVGLVKGNLAHKDDFIANLNAEVKYLNDKVRDLENCVEDMADYGAET